MYKHHDAALARPGCRIGEWRVWRDDGAVKNHIFNQIPVIHRSGLKAPFGTPLAQSPKPGRTKKAAIVPNTAALNGLSITCGAWGLTRMRSTNIKHHDKSRLFV